MPSLLLLQPAPPPPLPLAAAAEGAAAGGGAEAEAEADGESTGGGRASDGASAGTFCLAAEPAGGSWSLRELLAEPGGGGVVDGGGGGGVADGVADGVGGVAGGTGTIARMKAGTSGSLCAPAAASIAMVLLRFSVPPCPPL